MGVAAPGLALHEFQRILADPPDRLVAEIGEFLVFPRPADRLFRRVDMRHLRAVNPERVAVGVEIERDARVAAVGHGVRVIAAVNNGRP